MVRRSSAAGWALAALAAAVLVVPAQPAWAGVAAATVRVDDAGNLTYSGLPGYAHHVTVSKAGTTVEVDDTRPVAFTGACGYPVATDETRVRCTVAPTSPDVFVETGDRNDRVTLIGGGLVHWRVSLGAGDDYATLATVDRAGSHVLGGPGHDGFEPSPLGGTFDGGDEGDTVNYAARTLPVVVDLAAGTGPDRLIGVEHVVGGSADDIITGAGEENHLTGGPGNDTLRGGDGPDWLIGGLGADRLSGGPGDDNASYVGHPAGVVADLDGVDDDGMPGERDRIDADIEALVGSPYADTLTGNSGSNTLIGDPPALLGGVGGDDILYGGGGPDVLYGYNGNDRMFGQGGDDALFGEAGTDHLDGGLHRDRCVPGPGGVGTVLNCEAG
jgi:Ca2+-binding RTX toxin-like protein